VQSGDHTTLIALYDRYSTLVYLKAPRILKNPASAEDVVQELFMRLWNGPEQVQGETLMDG
jgi:RNA polymerase sigma-70 factor, ECF subfamily